MQKPTIADRGRSLFHQHWYSIAGPAEQQRRRPGWLRLPGFGGGGGGGALHRDGGAGGGGGSAGASGGGGRNITIA